MKAKLNVTMILYRTNCWIGKLKIRHENILSIKIRVNDINLIGAERFDSFSSFSKFLRSPKAKGILDNDDYKQLYHSSTSTPAMYGLPKVHKPAVPLRPILSAIYSFNHEAAK